MPTRIRAGQPTDSFREVIELHSNVHIEAQSRQAKAATPMESPQENGGALHLGRRTRINRVDIKRQWNQAAVTESCGVML